MKLHLPKLLLTAVLAAVNTVGFQAYAEWAVDGTGGLDKMYGYDKDTPPEHVLGDVIVAPTDTGFDSDATEASLKNVFLCNGRDGKGTERTINQIILQDGVNFTVAKNPWLNESSSGWFSNLLIKELEFGNEGTGKGSFALQQAKSVVTLEAVSGTLSGVTNAGTLTIGKAEGTTALAGSMTNTGTLNLNGVLKIADLSGLKHSVEGNTLSNATHGFRVGNVTYSIASGGTINTSEGFSVTLGDTEDITESLNRTSSSISYTVTGSRGHVYEITSSYTTAVEYNGTSGDTAAATGFLMGNGTTLKLTGATTALSHKVTIAAGDGGKATVMFANGKTQTYGELGLNSLINVESGSYVLGISGAGTVVTTTHQNNATGFHGGEIFITDGGKLLLDGYDSLGWVDTATPKISILNGTLALSGRQTFSTDLDMQGGAIVEANSTTIEDNPPKIDVWTNMDWTVRGTGNVVKNGVAVNMRENVNIAIASGGELSIQGAFEGGSKLTKSGDGKLILDGVAKTLNGQLQMQAGTLQLGGTTAADGLVTLAGGINQTGGTVDVVGKAKIQGASTLGGAITVASTGELTLNSTYVLTGSFTVAQGGKVIGGNDLIRGANSGRPAEGTNGWDSTILTILQAAEGATVTGLNTAWYNNGAFEVETSTGEDGITSYLIDARFNYYVQDTDTKAEYSAATGLTGANTIYMNDGTTLVVKNDLNTSKVSVSESGKVNYEVDGANLTLAETAHSNIASVTLTQGAKFTMSWNSSIAEKISIGLSGGSLIAMRNGGAGHVLNADISVNGTGYISGSSTGDNSNVQGSIYGEGTLGLLRDQNNDNPWTVSAEIKDGSDGSLSVQVYGGKLDNGSPVTDGNNRVTLSGNNSYSGGTTIYGGTLTAAHTSALGIGAVTIAGGTLNLAAEGTLGAGAITMNGGKLQLSSNSTIASLNVTGGEILTNTKTLTVSGNLTASSSLYMKNGGTVEVLGNLQSSNTLGFYRDKQQTLILHGESNSVAVFDLSDENGSKGTLVLKENTDTTITNQEYTGRGALWMSANSGVELEKNASLSWLGTKVTAKEQGGSISTTANKNVYYAVTEATFENVDLTINSAGGGTTVRSKLTNSSITNNSESAISVINEANTLTGVRAIGGNITLQNVGESTSLNSLEVGAGKVVKVQTGGADSATAAVAVTGSATLGNGSGVEASLNVNAGAKLEVAGEAAVSGDLEVLSGGTIKFGNGSLLSVGGTLTLDASSVQLGFDIISATDVVLATTTTTGGMNISNVDSWTGAREYTFDGKTYTASLSATNDTLSLIFKEMIVDTTPITTTVSSYDVAYNEETKTSTLTLTVNADKKLGEGMVVNLELISEDMMQGILEQMGYPEGDPMVFLKLVGTNGGEILADTMNEVVFVKGTTGQNYWGEMVGGKLMYNVNRIPEPASATLSLAALMMLCARRRRRA